MTANQSRIASDVSHSAAWLDLQRHRMAMASTPLASIVLDDPQRFDKCNLVCDGLQLNYSMQYVTGTTVDLLVRLAEQQGVAMAREHMWGGEKINLTENRAVLHVALRQQNDKPVTLDGTDIIPDVRLAHKRMADFVDAVREGRWLGATGKPVKHVVNLGIGGSDLGPRAVVQALDPYTSGPVVHFVANADAFDLNSTLASLDPAETLFVVASKTFTTQETLLNAMSARKWIIDGLGNDNAVRDHFIAVSSSADKVEKFGIPPENMFPIWDWVGGRFSLWSSVGIGIALAIGMEAYDRLLAGAAAMDEHFRSAPLKQNLPVMQALLGIWNRNFLPAGALAVMPYAERLREFPRYLQQLEMESNGKSVTREGDVVSYGTSPVIFGECGTVGQHSFHQWFHQGSEIIPVDFIGVLEDDLNEPAHHRVLLANMVAQAGALTFGQMAEVKPHEVHVGGRPSTLLLLNKLAPYHLGLLLALYEHKIFVQGIIWNINSFDQPGVELGKKIARKLETPNDAASPTERFLADLYDRLL